MQYEGKLYGKVAGKYIELGTTEEYESWNLILQKRITELEAVLDRCREPVAYASDRAHENNAESLSRVYASIGPWICRVLSEGCADTNP